MSVQFSCGNNTKITQHLLCLLVWCQTVKAFTEMTHLGLNVSLNCALAEKEIYWILLKPPNSPVSILRLFSTSPTPFYSNVTFRHKYLVEHAHSLFITNVTIDELGVYYCMTTDAPPKFSNGTTLKIIEPAEVPVCQNHTLVKYIELNHTTVNYEQIQKPWMTIILISGLMHGVLVIVVIGFVCCYSRENAKQPESSNMPLKQLQEPNTMYTEVIFSLCEEYEKKLSAAAQIINRKTGS